MYEHMRNAFAAELAKVFKNADIDIILANLDRVAVNYDVTEKTTALTVWEDSFPQIAKTYIAVKSLEGITFPRRRRKSASMFLRMTSKI